MLRKWCGSQTPTITSSGSVMFLKFRSDESGLNTGFHLQYSGVNTPPYASTLKAGTVAGVVCGVVVITSILVVIISIIVRRKHKNQQHAGRNRIHRNRRSHRNYRLPSNGEPCRWEVNHVFYSNHSGDAIISPPPYSFVAGTPFIYESPPPYPAEEFVRLPKDDRDERLSGQIMNDDAQNTSPQSLTADPTTSRGTDECNNVETMESQRSGEAATSIIHSKPKPRYSIKPNASRESTSGRYLAQTNRAISVDNLMPECQPLSLAVPRSQETSSRLSSQTRAASVDNLLSGRTGRQERGYDRQVSQSEMMLNRDTERQDTNTYQQSGGTTMSRPNRRPERPVRQREREDIRRRTLSDHRPEDPSTNDGAQRSSNRASENRYKRTGKETTEPRGHRYRQRSEFEDMRQRSRSCENLTSDRPSNHSQQNPRWSVASEGYMNERYPSAHRAGNYGNTSASVSNIPERANRAVPTERVPSRSGSGLLAGETRASSPQRRNLNPAKDDKIHRGREPDHHVRPSRQNKSPDRHVRPSRPNNSPDRHVRPSQYSSRGNLTKVEEEVSGYARRSSEVLAFDDNVSLSGERGQPTETSV